jgi:HSP20 family protein
MAQYSLYRPWAADAWGPFEQLRRDMDAALGRFGGSPLGSTAGRGVYPAFNVYEAADAYILSAELPGVEPGDIHLSVEGSTITLEGQRKIDYPNESGSSLHRRERQAGSFRRAMQLPAKIDADKIEASYRNGVLVARLPKAAEHQPRQIAVQAG